MYFLPICCYYITTHKIDNTWIFFFVFPLVNKIHEGKGSGFWLFVGHFPFTQNNVWHKVGI